MYVDHELLFYMHMCINVVDSLASEELVCCRS